MLLSPVVHVGFVCAPLQKPILLLFPFTIAIAFASPSISLFSLRHLPPDFHFRPAVSIFVIIRGNVVRCVSHRQLYTERKVQPATYNLRFLFVRRLNDRENQLTETIARLSTFQRFVKSFARMSIPRREDDCGCCVEHAEYIFATVDNSITRNTHPATLVETRVCVRKYERRRLGKLPNAMSRWK